MIGGSVVCRHCSAIAAIIVLLTAITGIVCAEVLPTQGKFAGFYHRDLAGVGRFEFFLVPPQLHERLAGLDGKYIELEVLKGRQPINPGPAVIDELGEIKVLSQPPIAMDFMVLPRGANSGESELLLRLKNTSDEIVEVEGEQIQIRYTRWEEKRDAPDQQRDFFGYGYSSSKLSGREGLWLPPMSTDYSAGQRTYSHIGYIRLRPGEEAPFLSPLPLPPGRFELAATARFVRLTAPTKEHSSIAAWSVVNLPVAREEPLPLPLRVESKVRYIGDRIVVEGRFFNVENTPRRLLVKRHPARTAYPGLIQVLGTEGKVLPFEVEPIYPDGPWVLETVGGEGLPFEFRLRVKDHFAPNQPEKIQLELPTSAGLERLELANQLPTRPLSALPPWGESVDGVRCRIRMAKDTFSSREPVRLFVQIESQPSAPQVFRSAKEAAIVEVDGVKAKLSFTIPGDHIIPIPYQSEITLNRAEPIPVGAHKLRVEIQAEGPETLTQGTLVFRTFRGRLVSNEVKFRIVD